MPTRCFVALLPDASTRQALAALRPGRSAGVVPAPVDGLHLTLHFCAALADADLARVTAALPGLVQPLLPLRALRTTAWRPGPRHAVLVAEYQPDGRTLALRDAVLALTGGGPDAPDMRVWRPHVTLARRYDAQPFEPSAALLPPFRAEALALVTSTPGEGHFVHHTRVRAALPAA